MEEMKEGNELIQLLSSFSCTLDDDIEHFLHCRAVEFEKLSKSRTYLICDREQLENGCEPLKIYGYISLALKILSVPEDVSNNIRKELDGFSAKIHGERISDFPCYLIGQLARATNVSKDSVSGEKLIGYACDIIASAVEAVGGRYIMIECRNKPELIQFYEKNRFKEIARIPDGDQAMVQMIRKI